MMKFLAPFTGSLSGIIDKKNKKVIFPILLGSVLIISSLGALLYLWFFQIPALNKNVFQLNSKLETVISDVKNKDDINKSLQSELDNVNKSKADLDTSITQLNSKLNTVVSDAKNKDVINKSLQSELGDVNKAKTDLENRVKSNETALSKQQACTKANEFSQIPGDMVIRGGTTEACNLSGVDYLPSSTQGVLDYLHGLIKNYQDTKLWTWKHGQEPCQADAEKYIPILEQRFSDYQNYKTQCDA